MIIFSLLYGVISYSYAYYGEMMTYLGMTMTMVFYFILEFFHTANIVPSPLAVTISFAAVEQRQSGRK